MKVIIDGYNVLHQMNTKHVGDAERKYFINLLSAYAKRKHLEVIVVFDAGPFLFPSTEVQKGITVKYSGPKTTADEIIVRIMQQHKGQGMLLISSDRELRDAAKEYKTESLSSPEFIVHLLEREQQYKVPAMDSAVKTSATTNAAVDALMQQAKVPVKSVDTADEELQNRRAPAHRESKKERMLSAKIKKL